MKSIVVIFALLLGTELRAATIVPDSVQTGYDTTVVSQTTSSLTIDSPIAGVKVFLDTTMIGIAPLQRDDIPQGTHIMHFVHPDGNNWLYPAFVETLIVHPSAHLHRTVRFPKHYHIITEPYGATVYDRDSALGTTPLYIVMHDEKELITLVRDGFVSATIPLPPSGGEVFTILSPVSGITADKSLFLSYEQSKNPTPIVIAAGATILTGAAAAYCKIKADGYYNDYQQTGDVGALDNVRHLDVVSGVSLAASQISLFILSYLLFSR